MLADRIRSQLGTHLARRYSTHQIPTHDGWSLQAHRIRPGVHESGPPVVLIPGHANTSWVFFGARDGGIVNALVEAGRDVWTLDLRGTGDIEQCGRRGPVGFFEKLTIDVPTAFEHIRRESGWDVIDAVGHSVGGILLYLHALEERAQGLGRIVAISSPLRVSQRLFPAPTRGRIAQFLVRRLGRLPLGGAMNGAAGLSRTTWMRTHFDPETFCAGDFRNFLHWGVCDVYGPELSELLAWINGTDPRCLFTDNCLEKKAGRLGLPALFMVGAKDGVFSPESVCEAYLTLGGPDRTYVVAGREHGFTHDYRHTDILLGNDVATDVGPYIATWLNAELPSRGERGIDGRAQLEMDLARLKVA